MRTLQEKFEIKQINIEDFKPDFPNDLKDYIDIILIKHNCDISISLKEKYVNSLSVKSKISKALKFKGVKIKITFEDLLPF